MLDVANTPSSLILSITLPFKPWSTLWAYITTKFDCFCNSSLFMSKAAPIILIFVIALCITFPSPQFIILLFISGYTVSGELFFSLQTHGKSVVIVGTVVGERPIMTESQEAAIGSAHVVVLKGLVSEAI